MWSILGIKETKNKIEIKEAYMTKLQKINPEDDEEGFKKLRAAYEEALKFSDSDEVSEGEDTTSIGIWVNKVKELYSKFSLRIDEEAWREILESDVCFSIDTRAEASKKLLEFLMDCFYIPKKIWILFDEYFSYADKREELIEGFPENYIDYVIDKVNSNYGDSLDYYLFEEIDDSKDYDLWISLFFKIRTEIGDENIDEAEKDFSEIEKIHINHPSFNVLYLRKYLIKGETEKAREVGEDLLKRYPNKVFAIYAMAVIECRFKNFESAKGYYKNILEIDPDDYNSKSGLADCYLEIGDFKEAEGIFRDLLDINRNDNYVRDKLFIIVNKHIEELEKECESNADNKKIKFTLGWYYFENYRYDDVINLCGKLDPDKEDENQHYDLISRAYIAKDEFDLALEYINKWEKNIKIYEDNIYDRENDVALLYYEKGRALSKLSQYEEALDYFDKVLEIQNDDIFALNSKANVLNKLKKYEESLKVIETGLELDYSDVLLHINKSEALFELKSYREAIDECNITIDIYPYYTNPYLIKMKIYALYDRYDEILEIAQELERLDISDFNTDIYKIKALTSKERYEEAQDLAISLLKTNNKNKCDDLHKVYYELAGIQYDKGLYEKALGYINKAIKNSIYEEVNFGLRASIYRHLRKFDLAIQDYDTIIERKIKPDWYLILKKAETYEEMRKLDKASVLYEEVLKLNPENGSVTNFSIGKIYEEMNNYDKALEYFSKQIEIEEDAYYYIYRGVLHAKNNKFNEAIEDYKSAIKLEPENPYPYNNLAIICENRNEYEKAINYYRKAIEFDKDGKDKVFYNNIIDCYIYLNNTDMALMYFDKANRAIKYDEKFYLKKAKLLKKMKAYDKAIETYEQALKIQSFDSEKIYEEMASTFEKIEEYHKAIECYNEILKKASKYTDAYRKIGYMYYKLEDYENAIKYYELQSKSNGWYPISKATNQLLIGNCYEKLKDEENANKNYTEALNKFLKTKRLTPYECTYIGKCYKGLNKNNEAIEYFERALNMELCESCEHKGCYDGYFGLGEIYEKEEKYQETLKYYKKALEVNEDDKLAIEGIERIENLLKSDDNIAIEAKERIQNSLIGKVGNLFYDIRNRFRNNK